MSEEKFRNWEPRGFFNVAYKVGGETKYWTANQKELLEKCIEILADYERQGIILTSRQLYYQLVGGRFGGYQIPNAMEIYKRVCSFLTDARYGGLIDWEAIDDKGRVPEKHAEWENVKSLVESAVYSYRLPRWQDQEYYVEMYCEKQAGESVLKPIADKYHIYFGYNKGYCSASTMYDLAQRIKEKIEEGKHCIILYFGDHDPSGLDMIRDIRERIEEFLTKGDDEVEPNFDVVPLALNMEQIKKYNPPPNPAKITDSRAKKYIAEFGSVSWELDALDARVVQRLAEAGIQRYLDTDKYHAWIERETREINALKKFAERMSKD